MFLVKVLEKTAVIRTFGAALVLAPFVNTLVKMIMLPPIANRWSLAMFWRIIEVGSVANQTLYIATIVIGLLMLRGSATVWKYVLFLLGGYILLQITDFKTVKSSGVTWFFFIVNVVSFLFVADQLVWKVKAPTPKPQPRPPQPQTSAAGITKAAPPKPTATSKPATPPPAATAAAKAAAKSSPQPAYRVIPKVRKKILFQFAGRGPWGQLMGISREGIHVRGLSEPPADIATREIEIALNNGRTLRTRLVHRKEHDYYFDHTHFSSDEIKSLNKWLSSLTTAA